MPSVSMTGPTEHQSESSAVTLQYPNTSPGTFMPHTDYHNTRNEATRAHSHALHPIPLTFRSRTQTRLLSYMKRLGFVRFWRLYLRHLDKLLDNFSNTRITKQGGGRICSEAAEIRGLDRSAEQPTVCGGKPTTFTCYTTPSWNFQTCPSCSSVKAET